MLRKRRLEGDSKWVYSQPSSLSADSKYTIKGPKDQLSLPGIKLL